MKIIRGFALRRTGEAKGIDNQQSKPELTDEVQQFLPEDQPDSGNVGRAEPEGREHHQEKLSEDPKKGVI